MAGRHIRRAEDHAERRRRGLILTAVFLGVALSGALVLTISRAAFSDTTSNTGNSLSTGTVVLTDNAGSALFTVAEMVPGQTETRCIEVTYSGSIADPSGVVLYSGGYSGSATLAGELVLTVREGTASATCASFTSGGVIFNDTVDAFDTSNTGYGSGVGTWNPSSTPETRAYELEIALPTSATASGASVTDLTVTWEVQS